MAGLERHGISGGSRTSSCCELGSFPQRAYALLSPSVPLPLYAAFLSCNENDKYVYYQLSVAEPLPVPLCALVYCINLSFILVCRYTSGRMWTMQTHAWHEWYYLYCANSFVSGRYCLLYINFFLQYCQHPFLEVLIGMFYLYVHALLLPGVYTVYWRAFARERR